MALTIGAVLAFLVGAMATAVGLDRDRALYPVAMLVIASYYVLFAVMGGASPGTLVLELTFAAGFAAAAIAGFRSSLWIVVAALAAHGVTDFFHGSIIHNPGVPHWWADFCGAYDVVAAGYLAWLLRRKAPRLRSSPGEELHKTRSLPA